MKLFTIIILLTAFTVYPQDSESFIFKNKKVNYTLYNYAEEGITDFYIIIDDAENLKEKFEAEIVNCNRTIKNRQFYLLSIPKDITTNTHMESLFLEFVTHILGRIKLIDSNLYVVSAKNLDNLYNQTKIKSNNMYKHTYLNDIKGSYASVCEVPGF